MDRIDKIGIELLSYMKDQAPYRRLELENKIKIKHRIENIPANYLKLWTSFALTRLTNQNLIIRLNRGIYQITNSGLEKLEKN